MAELLTGVSHADYQEDRLPGAPHFSRSVAVALLERSPLQVWARHPALGNQVEDGPDPDAAKQSRMEFGSLVHLLLLGGGLGIAEIEADSWRTNAAKEQRDLARDNGLLPVLTGKYRHGLKVAEEIKKRMAMPGSMIPIEDCAKEVTILWEDDGVACKARLDLFFHPHEHHSGAIWDLKISDLTPGAFARGLPYDGCVQAWAYEQAAAAVYPELAGRCEMEFVICQPEPPYDVAIVPVGGTLRSLGEMKWKRALKIWKRCLESGKWPGHGRVAPAEASSFALQAELVAAGDAADPDWMKGA